MMIVNMMLYFEAITRFPPLGGPLPKKQGGPLHTLKILLQIVSPPPKFLRWAKKGGPVHTYQKHTTYAKNTIFSMFFFQFTGSTFPEIECLHRDSTTDHQ